MRILLSFIVSIIFISLDAQVINTDLLHKPWNSFWITVPDYPKDQYSVCQFRKEFKLDKKPDTFIVHVSADNQYKLYVNSKLVSLGPVRGDLNHWYFETVDIAPYLQQGTNTIARLIWNHGALRAENQISYQTAFILQGNTIAEQTINTNETWNCIRSDAYSPLKQNVIGHYVAGPGERVDMNMISQEWLGNGFNVANWHSSQKISRGIYKGVHSAAGQSPWMLIASPLPSLELKKERLNIVCNAQGLRLPGSFPKNKVDITIPPKSNVSILLDQGYLTNAFLSIVFSKGKNSTIAVKYAESLYESKKKKGNRNIIEGKTFIGRCDSIISSGESSQNYTTLSWRTFRYLQLDILTGEDPLIINDLYGTFIGYPFKLNASLKTEDRLMSDIFQIGWRTARLCAVDTYMDCPYYEQLQYIGDTRIQALIS